MKELLTSFARKKFFHSTKTVWKRIAPQQVRMYIKQDWIIFGFTTKQYVHNIFGLDARWCKDRQGISVAPHGLAHSRERWVSARITL